MAIERRETAPIRIVNVGYRARAARRHPLHCGSTR